MALANVTLINTFDEWRTRTNQIIYKIDEIDGNVTNTRAYANTTFMAKAGGTFTGNVSFSGTNTILDLL
jgi:hypothetical protein